MEASNRNVNAFVSSFKQTNVYCVSLWYTTNYIGMTRCSDNIWIDCVNMNISIQRPNKIINANEKKACIVDIKKHSV
jgi:hypothetical protein